MPFISLVYTNIWQRCKVMLFVYTNIWQRCKVKLFVYTNIWQRCKVKLFVYTNIWQRCKVKLFVYTNIWQRCKVKLFRIQRDNLGLKKKSFNEISRDNMYLFQSKRWRRRPNIKPEPLIADCVNGINIAR